MNRRRTSFLLSTTSAVVVSMVAFPAAAAPVTYDTGSSTLSNANNTTDAGTTITTNGLEDQGAFLTGNGTGSYTWNFTGADLTVAAASTPGLINDRSRGSSLLNFDNTPVVGNGDAGISIVTTGSSGTFITLTNNASVVGGGSGANSAGIFINATSTAATRISVDTTSSVTNGTGAAAIDVVRNGSTGSFLSSDGTIDGGNSGHGVYLHDQVYLSSFTNNNNGTITGGNTGTSHGVLIEAERSVFSGTGVRNFTNNGIISGGATLGNGINLQGNGQISNILNNSGTIQGGGGDSHGIALGDNSSIGTLSNNLGGTLQGGAGTGDGLLLDDNSTITNLSNSGTVNSGTTAGNGIDIRGNASINDITNSSTGAINGNATNGFGVLAQGDNPGDTATFQTLSNSGSIAGGTGSAAIGLLGGDNTAAATSTSVSNLTGGSINGGAGGDGVLVGSYHTLGQLYNSGGISSTAAGAAAVHVTGHGGITTLTQENAGSTIGNTNYYGILSDSAATGDTATISTLSNSAGTISGGGAGNAAIGLLGGDNNAGLNRVTTTLLQNISSGTIQGATGADGVQVGNYHQVTSISNVTGTIAGNGGSAAGIRVRGNGIVTSIGNGTNSTNGATSLIAGSNAAAGGTGIALEDNAVVTAITNYGTISPFLNATSTAGTGIAVGGNATLDTIHNHGTIRGGTASGAALNASGAGALKTINNYSDGSITGATAINLATTAPDTTFINTAGSITGDIQLGTTFALGDTVNIYGGTINGNILGADNSGTLGIVNFDLVGGTFGTGGVSGDSGQFTTSGSIGTTGNRLFAAYLSSGEVILNNDIYAANTNLSGGTTLTVGSNNNTIIGHLNNSGGTVNLGTYHLTVGGNIGGNGTIGLTIQPGNGGSHGYITNGGGNVLVSNMTFVPSYAAGDVAVGEHLVLIDTPGTLTYDSLSMQSRNGIRWLLTQADSNGSDFQGFGYSAGALLATAYSLTSGISGPNSNSINALSGYTGTDGDILALLGGLTSDTDNDQAGAQLRPNANGGNALAALSASDQAHESVAARLNGGSGITGVASGEALAGIDFWMKGFGSFMRQSRIDGIDGFDADTYGATLGADREIVTDLRIGAAVTYANTSLDERGTRQGSGANIDSYIGNFYGRYDTGPWYADASIIIGRHAFDATRLVTFTGPSIASADFDTDQLGGSFEAGAPIYFGPYSLTPYAGYSYDSLRQEGYAETGAGGANLVVSGSDTYSSRTTLGAKAASHYQLANGWLLRPALFAAYRHEFNDSIAAPQNVSFAGGGVSFATPGMKLPQDAALFGLDVDLMASDNFTLTARYAGELREEYTSNSVQLKARLGF